MTISRILAQNTDHVLKEGRRSDVRRLGVPRKQTAVWCYELIPILTAMLQQSTSPTSVYHYIQQVSLQHSLVHGSLLALVTNLKINLQCFDTVSCASIKASGL